MENLRTTICPKCGTEITGKHLTGTWINAPANLYGGRVKKLKDAVCACGTEFVAYLQPDNNNYKIIDLAYKNEPADGVQEVINEPPEEDSEKHKMLVAQAKALGIRGVLENMKESTLIKKIEEAQKNQTE